MDRKVTRYNIRDVRTLLSIPVPGDRDIIMHCRVYAFEFPGNETKRRGNNQLMGSSGDSHLEPTVTLRKRIRFFCRTGKKYSDSSVWWPVPGKKPFCKSANLNPLHGFCGIYPHHTTLSHRCVWFKPFIIGIKMAHNRDMVCVHPAPGFDQFPEF